MGSRLQVGLRGSPQDGCYLIPAPHDLCLQCPRSCLRRDARYQHPAWQEAAPGSKPSVLAGRDPGGPGQPAAV